MDHVRHREGVVHVVHFVPQHQHIALAHTEFLGHRAGNDHLALFGGGGHLREIGAARVDAQHGHIQIVAVGSLAEGLSVGRGAALRHLLGGVFVGVAVFVGGLQNAAPVEVVAVNIAVQRDHQHQQADEHAAQHRKGRAQLPQQLAQLEPGQEAQVPQVDAGDPAGVAGLLLTAQQ